MTALRPVPAPKRESRFFLFFTWLLLGLVVTGFAPSFFLRFWMSDTAPPLPLYLHLHGALLTAWFALLVFQAALVRGDRLGLHQKLGPWVAAYGLIVAGGALMATFGYVPRELAKGFTFATDMALVNPLQASGMSFLDFSTALVCLNIASVLGFVCLLGLAVAARGRPDFHKRYLLFASLSIVAPALARISRILLQTEQGPVIPVGLALLALAIVAHDFSKLGRIHRASLNALVFLGLINGVAGLLALSPYGKDFVQSLA